MAFPGLALARAENKGRASKNFGLALKIIVENALSSSNFKRELRRCDERFLLQV